MSPRIKQVGAPLRVYIMQEIDTVLSPYNVEYTLDWYNKVMQDNITLDQVQEIILFIDDGVSLKQNYSQVDKQLLYWEPATATEIQKIGDNYMLQPTPSPIGIIKNDCGEVYTQHSYYEAIEKYKDITEPYILCSKEV